MTADIHKVIHEIECRILAARNAVDETDVIALHEFSTLVYGLSIDLVELRVAVLRDVSARFPDDFMADHSLACYFHFVCKNKAVARPYAKRGLARLNASGERAEDHRAEFVAQELISILETPPDDQR